ncbi:MAG: transcription antitermination factor NusB [Clostridia bacterium]
MSRTTAREHTFKILYGLQFNNSSAKEFIESYIINFVEEPVQEEDRDFICERDPGRTGTHGTVGPMDLEALKGWKISRLSRVDLAILRLSAYEIMFSGEIPVSVSINEAVNLAKKYSQDAAPAFINGILGNVSQRAAEAAQQESGRE